jgi:acetyl-CoA carboxylase carboxyl transferase subunit alpha
MKLQPLEFEKPVLELEAKLADLRSSSAASDINIEAEAAKLEEKL